jgi:hypothetical protein
VPTEDRFAPDHPLPLFLSARADERVQRSSSRLLKASALVITATVSGIAIALWLGNPVKVVGDVTASLADTSGLRPGTDQSPPTIQSTPDAQALPPTARGATTSGDEAAATSEAADQSLTQISEPPSGTLLKQFRAWAANEDARAQAEPAVPVENAPAQAEPVPPVQNARAQVLEDDRAPVRPLRKHRRLRPLQNARAEIRPLRNPRTTVLRHQNARAEVRPVQDPRARDPSVQNAPPPSFLQSLGWQ